MSNLVSTITEGANNFAAAVGGLLGARNELARQRLAHDEDFCKPTIVLFELQISAGDLLTGNRQPASYIFPLACPPQSITIQEPFAMEATPGLDSALWTDESGVVQRRITIAGTAGFFPFAVAPKPLSVVGIGSTLPKNYFDRDLQSVITQAISGSRHQQYLQDTIFRAYSDAKRDPAKAKNVHLIYHSVNDGDHFEVKPVSYATQRSASSPFTYPYQIELLVVGRASATKVTALDDDITLLGTIRSTVAALYGAAATLRGAVQDLTSTLSSFRILGQQIVGIIDAASSVVAAVDQFVTGASFFLNLPLAAVSALFNFISTTLNTYSNAVSLGTQVVQWPDVIVAKFRMMQNATDLLRTHPESFEAPLSQRLAALNTGQADQAQGLNTVAVSSFEDVIKAGSANLPGDAVAAAGNLVTRPQHAAYRSVINVVVAQGDTLAALAQKYLGNVIYFSDIAQLNGLRAPFTGADGKVQTSLLDAAQDTGVLGVGQILQIPSSDAPPTPATGQAVLGAGLNETPAVQLLGRDLALFSRNVGGNFRYDFGIVTRSDGTSDFATVEGLANIQQAIVQRLTRIRGSCPLTPDVGVQNVIGTGQLEADSSMLEYRLREQVTADPRIIEVESFEVDSRSTELHLDARLRVAGVANSVSVNVFS